MLLDMKLIFFILAGFIVTFQEAIILRLECKTFAIFSKITRIKVNSASNLLATYKDNVNTVERCVGLCISNPSCWSINYRQAGAAGGKCNLLDVRLGDIGPNDVTSKDGWLHYETSDNNKLNGHVCLALSPCNGHYCEDTCDGEGYKCTCSEDKITIGPRCQDPAQCSGIIGSYVDPTGSSFSITLSGKTITIPSSQNINSHGVLTEVGEQCKGNVDFTSIAGTVLNFTYYRDTDIVEWSNGVTWTRPAN